MTQPKEIHQIQALKKLDLESLNELVEELNIRLFSLSTSFLSTSFDVPYAKISDVKAYNVAGGTFTSGAWRTRTLNTEYDPQGIVSLSASQFTLQAGTYRIYAIAPAYRVDRHVAVLYNITDDTRDIIGSSSFDSNASGLTMSVSTISGEFIITAAKVFEIQHRCATTQASSGLGLETNLSDINSVYTIVEIWKLA